MRNVLLSLVLACMMCFGVVGMAWASENGERTIEIEIIKYDALKQDNLTMNSNADLLIKSNSKVIPAYIDEAIYLSQIDETEIRELLNEANKKTEQTDYNLFVVNDDLTYFYSDVDGEVTVYITESEHNTALLDDYIVQPYAHGYESAEQFPHGIGCKAYTFASNKAKFEATFYSDNIEYAGSEPNNSTNTGKIINLYNYIGNVSKDGIATDL